jgi:large subunit ribosomal protein L35
MPKQKSHSGAKKRFKLSAKGKVIRRHTMRSHLLGKKAQKRKRGFRKPELLGASDSSVVKKLLGK